MKKLSTRIISVLMCVSILATMFTGCQGEKKPIEYKAADVAFNDKGEYKTTVTAEKVEFSDITAEMVKVTYGQFDAENETSKDVEVTVTDVSAQKDSLTVSFVDPDAKVNQTENYTLSVADKEISVPINVAHSEFELTTEDCVLATDKTAKLTFVLSDSEFSPEITAEDIELYGSFEGFEIEAMSASGKNLTLQIKGDIPFDKSSGTYLDGTVIVGNNGIVNAFTDTSASVPVTTKGAYFVPAELKAVGENKFVIPLRIMGLADVNKLAADKISFEKGVKVEDLKKETDSRVLLTLNIADAKNANEAAKIMNEQTVKVDGNSMTVYLFSASFYPVFDYVEEKDSKLKFTLNLYAQNGVYAQSLTNDMLSFGDAFKDAEIVSFKRTSDTVAELVIAVPANGQTVEALDMNGTVTLAANALISSWGDALSEPASYTRYYTQDSMGRDFSAEDIEIMKNIVGGFGNTTMGTITAIGSGLATAGSGLVTALELTGVIESEKVKLDKIISELDTMSKQLDEIKDTIDKEKIKSRLTAFKTDLALLSSSCKLIRSDFNDLERDLESGIDESIIRRYFNNAVPSIISKYATTIEVKNEKDGTVSKENVIQIKKPAKNASHAEWHEYNSCMVYIAGVSKAADFKDLTTKFDKVITYMNKDEEGESFLSLYDQYMTYLYNFDTSAYKQREDFRTTVKFTLLRATTLIGLYCAYGDGRVQSSVYNNYLSSYKKAVSFIDSNKVEPRTDNKVKCYVYNNKDFKQQMEYSCHSRAKKGDGGHYAIFNDSKLTYYADGSVKSYADVGHDFSADQMRKFVARMKVRGVTMKQELDGAGFQYNKDGKDPNGNKLNVYDCIFDYKEKNGSEWYHYEASKRYPISGVAFYSKQDTSPYSSKIIPFDTSPAELSYEGMEKYKITWVDARYHTSSILICNDKFGEADELKVNYNKYWVAEWNSNGSASTNVRFVLNWVLA